MGRFAFLSRDVVVGDDELSPVVATRRSRHAVGNRAG
jgi:hypothetical protein